MSVSPSSGDDSSMNITTPNPDFQDRLLSELRPEVSSLRKTMYQLTYLLQPDERDATAQMEVECDVVDRMSNPTSDGSHTLEPECSQKSVPKDDIYNLLKRIFEQTQQLSTFHTQVREEFDAVLREFFVAITQVELDNRANLELEREIALGSVQEPAVTPKYESDPKSILDQTVVFELMEKLEAESRNEMARLKSDNDTQMEHYKSEIAHLKKELEVAQLEHKKELGNLHTQYDQAKADCDHLNEVCREMRANHTKALEDSRSECIRIKEDFDRLTLDFKNLQTDYTRKCEELRAESSQWKSTIQAVVDRFVPHSLFPLVREPLPRLSHAFDTILRRCPWLFSVVTDENQDPSQPIPNPATLHVKHQHLSERLILERNDALDKLQRVTDELTLTQEARDSLKAQLDSATVEQEQCKEELTKLNKKVARYKGYIQRLFDPNVAARLAAMYSSSGDIGAEAADQNVDKDVTDHPLPGFSATFSDEGSTVSSKCPIQNPKPHSKEDSPSVLSKMGAAVSALATAIISPRRTSAPVASPGTVVSSRLDTSKSEAAPVEQQKSQSDCQIFSMRDRTLSDRHARTPLAAMQPQVSMTNVPPNSDDLCSNPENNVFRVPVTKSPTGSTNVKAPASTTATPFAIPTIPRPPFGGHGKRKVLGEIPISSSSNPISCDGPVQAKPLGFDPNASFLAINPLAESTSGPFHHPPQMPTEVAKKARPDRLDALPKPFAVLGTQHDASSAKKPGILRVETPAPSKQAKEEAPDCVLC